MQLVIDFGNSRIKTAIFDNYKLLGTHTFTDLLVCDLELLLRENPAVNSCIYAASGYVDASIQSYLGNTFPNLLVLSGNSKLPFNNLYESKQTQGPDRIAAIAGAQALYPNANILIIDAGTAITFDFIDKHGNYLGGNIAPGFSLRYKALNSFTSKLPLLEKNNKFDLLGKTTNEAIVCGVQNGIIFETECYIEALQDRYNNLTTIMTGGDADFLADKLKYPIFVHANLVLTGLNRILQYNAQ